MKRNSARPAASWPVRCSSPPASPRRSPAPGSILLGTPSACSVSVRSGWVQIANFVVMRGACTWLGAVGLRAGAATRSRAAPGAPLLVGVTGLGLIVAVSLHHRPGRRLSAGCAGRRAER